MPRFILAVLCTLILPTVCLAQKRTAVATPAPREVSLCDLKHNPANYDGQWITVRGRVSMEFEDFSLYDPDCHAPELSGVWLTFGGDQDEITTYCCVNPTRKKGTDIEAGGHRVPLVRDEALHEILRVLQTQRLRRPDGRECDSDECYYYRPVTAKITGLFLAGKGDGRFFSGYGHLGCCHLLVISQVADVAAERTPVPAGGQFKCSKDIWNVGQPDAAEFKSLLGCAKSKNEACDHDRQAAFERFEAHWNELADRNRWHADRDVEGSGWISADLLTIYSTVNNGSSASAEFSVIRQVCAPVTGQSPNPASNAVSCQKYAMSWRDDEHLSQLINRLIQKQRFAEAQLKIGQASQSILSEGDQSWRLGDAQNAARHALQLQAQKWGLVPETPLQHDNCDDASLPEQKSHIVGCNRFSNDGTQEFWVALQKPKSAKAGAVSNPAWVVTEISATICH